MELRSVVAAVQVAAMVRAAAAVGAHEWLAVEWRGEEIHHGASLLFGLGGQLPIARLNAILLHSQRPINLIKIAKLSKVPLLYTMPSSTKAHTL